MLYRGSELTCKSALTGGVLAFWVNGLETEAGRRLWNIIVPIPRMDASSSRHSSHQGPAFMTNDCSRVYANSGHLDMRIILPCASRRSPRNTYGGACMRMWSGKSTEQGRKRQKPLFASIHQVQSVTSQSTR